jgi:outer membrane protein assembly factor BamB
MAVVRMPAGGLTVAPRALWTAHLDVRGTPAADDRSVYARTMSGDVVAVDRRTGALRWRARLSSVPGMIRGGRIATAAGLVFAGDDDLQAIAASDGRLVWQSQTGRGDGVGVYLGGSAAGLVFTGSYAGALVALDVSDGHVRWRGAVGFAGQTTVFPPVVSGDRVFVTFTSFGDRASGGVASFDLAGHRLWQTALGADSDRGAVGLGVVARDIVLASSRAGRLFAIDRRTGQVRWFVPPEAATGTAEDFRPLGVVGDRVVAGSLRGEIVAYDLASRRSVWRAWPVDASVAFGLTTTAGAVYVPYVSGHLVELDPDDGQERWRVGGWDAGFRWAPAVAGPTVFASGAGAGLVAFQDPGGPE